MKIVSIKTHKVVPGNNLFEIFDASLPKLEEKSIVSITSKIISICGGEVVRNDGSISKDALIKKEAAFYLGDEYTPSHGYRITISHGALLGSAGIDESNGDGYFILLPKNLQETTNKIWEYLRQKHKIQQVGVIVTDSHCMPLRKGTTGIGLSWCGFEALRNYIATPDIFGRNLKVTKASLLDGFAASAVVVMGEGNEQTPIAIMTELPGVVFQDRVPSKEELEEITISVEQDVFAPILQSVHWLSKND